MRRPVIWSREALDDIKEQVNFIAQDNPAAARRVANRFRVAGRALGDMATGRPGRVSGTYEMVIPRLPYILVYALTYHTGRESVSVLRVVHAARDWQDEEWPQ